LEEVPVVWKKLQQRFGDSIRHFARQFFIDYTKARTAWGFQHKKWTARTKR
jgi:hypothetical protein